MYQQFWRAGYRYLLLLLVMQCLTAAAFAQIKIAGRVTDETGAPLPGITVAVKNTRSGATTGVEGTYAINADLKPGAYTLVFTGIGFSTRETAITIDEGKSYTVNQQLAVSVET